MKHISKLDAKEFANSQTCTVHEYQFEDKDINGAIGTINGRYPEQGFVVNEVCKELVYVLSGNGRLVTEKQSIQLLPEDMALINPGEKYYFDGTELKLLMPCTPAWFPEQHKETK
jgi:mannose-6-phosphate isomerase-like protein (cupin superfamily)